MHFYVFGCKAYIDNGYHFIYHIQGNITFYSTHAIFDKELFPKCTDFHAKKYKLYNRLLDKISLETELSVPNFSGKNGPAPVSIPHTYSFYFPPIQNNPSTCSSLPSLFYKSLSLLSTPGSKKPIVEIEEEEDVNSNVEI